MIQSPSPSTTLTSMLDAHTPDLIDNLSAAIARLHTSPPPADVLPSHETLSKARATLKDALPEQGAGLEATIQHLTQDLGPALNASSRSATYYGFVTGGSTPAAALADNLVTHYDQNVQVHLPDETLATEIEDRALTLLCSLIDFSPTQWPHRTFTTGATASNILGLACGREYVVAKASAASAPVSVGEHGIVEAMRLTGLTKIQILTTVPHSSLSKAASILGLGRSSIRTLGRADAPHKFDMAQLQFHLAQPHVASIVCISASEVNTGLFATSSLSEMQQIRTLCDTYSAWLHIDGAFGILARLLPPSSPYTTLHSNTAGLDLADSLTGDAHKLLNVPYDSGFFLSKHRALAPTVFQNPNAAYLAAADNSSIISPLHAGMENSRRFRALPVYASLVAYGRSGYADMLARQIALARGIARFVFDSEAFELLPRLAAGADIERVLDDVFIIVLFRAKSEALNASLVARINARRKVYVSGTMWEGAAACRFAVSNWRVDVARDLAIIKDVLEEVAREE